MKPLTVKIFAQWLFLVVVMCLLASNAHSQNSNVYRALDFYAVTVSSTAVNAVTGATNDCQFNSPVDLIVDTVTTAGTIVSNSSQLLVAGQVFRCGRLNTGATISVNCSGGGTCGWQGARW